MQVSIVVALLTIGLKTLAWWLTGSVGLLSDALESFVNLAAAVFGLSMLTIAARPADAQHPFGHSKAEYFSSGFEGVLIMGAALAIIWAAAPRLWAPQPLEKLGLGLLLSLASSALNGVLAWQMLRAARLHRSIALEADARHLLSDVWTSAGVLVGLLLAGISGWLWLDALVAIAVALNIAREGAHLIWRSAQGLMDQALEPQEQARLQAALARISQSQPDWRLDHLRARRAAADRFASVHLHLPAHWTLAQAEAARAQVEAALRQSLPGLIASVHVLPLDAEPHEASHHPAQP